jgi:LacI family transcriptional regulator
MATIKQVAARAGVSSATVSHVVNGTRFVSDPVQQRVRQAMEELSYRPNALARSLRKGTTRTFGLILPDSANPYFAELGLAIENVAFQQNYNIILCNTGASAERERLYFDLLLDKQVDGIIVDTQEKSPEQLQARLPGGFPIVQVDRDFSVDVFDIVITDNLLGGYEATKHLLGLGHQRIGCIPGSMQLSSGVHRLAGYKQALEEANIPVTKKLIAAGEFSVVSGRAAGQKLLSLPEPPTAIFAGNDMMAIGLLRSAVDLQLKVPDDLAIIGFDDIELSSYLYPTLTTIAQSKADIAVKVIELLMARIENPNRPPQRALIPPTLIVRESTRRMEEAFEKTLAKS